MASGRIIIFELARNLVTQSQTEVRCSVWDCGRGRLSSWISPGCCSDQQATYG